MKQLSLFIIISLLLASCSSQQKLSYLSNLPATGEPQNFPYKMLDYKVQYRDILYIDVKSMAPDGSIVNALQGNNAISMNYIQGEANQYLAGYNIDKDGHILLPVLGKVMVADKNLSEIRNIVQGKVDSVFNHAYVDVKLLSFRYTVLGEAKMPGSFNNYNDYVTVLEAIGKAGGIGDYGRRDRVLVVRSTPEGSKTYNINLQDKELLSSEAYFLMPNDIIIIEPLKHKIFNMNLPTISFAVSTLTGIITTTLLLINYFGK